MEKRWVYKEQPNTTAASEVASALGIDTWLGALLVQRGICSFEDARVYFSPSINDLHNPFGLKGMEEAVLRLQEAIENKERILIYGDYDVDGTTAIALVFGYLSRFHSHIDYYTPDRYKEGYGISWQGLAYAADNEFDLIIALDCGIKAVDKVKRARELGMDVIICDHHTPGDELPGCIVINPKQKECSYPYKELTGCGLGFKLMHAFAMRTGRSEKEVFDMLDLVALSIAADIVDMQDENRILAWFGMKILNEKRGNAGILATITNAGKAVPLTIEDLVFTVGPRINAAGRMDSAMEALGVLLSESYEEALEKGLVLEDLNEQRKSMDKQTTVEALEILKAEDGLYTSASTVVHHQHWHKGVVGIVASRLIETHYRPTIVLTEVDGMYTGSGRSINGFDLYEALSACEDVIHQFGGHTQAAGLVVSANQLQAFRERFNQVVRQRLGDEPIIPVLDIDMEVSMEMLTTKAYRIMNRMEPFGPGNMRPVFVMKGLVNGGGTRKVGDGSHLKFDLLDPSSGLRMGGIGFGLGELENQVLNGSFDIACTLEANEWNGRSSLQLNIKDVHLA